MDKKIKDKMMAVLSNPELAAQFAEFLNGIEEKSKTKSEKGGRPKKKLVEEDVVDLTKNEEKPNNKSLEGYEVLDMTKNTSKKRRGTMCRRVPISPPKNTFVDDGLLAREDYENFDKLVVHSKKSSTRKPVKYKIKCRECNEIKIVDMLIPKWDAEDSSTYVCDDCIPTRG